MLLLFSILSKLPNRVPLASESWRPCASALGDQGIFLDHLLCVWNWVLWAPEAKAHGPRKGKWIESESRLAAAAWGWDWNRQQLQMGPRGVWRRKSDGGVLKLDFWWWWCKTVHFKVRKSYFNKSYFNKAVWEVRGSLWVDAHPGNQILKEAREKIKGTR